MAKDFTGTYKASSVSFFQGNNKNESMKTTDKIKDDKENKENKAETLTESKRKTKTKEQGKKTGNKGGRPTIPENEQKTERITICATTDMKEKIFMTAKKKGMTTTALIFYYITKGLKEDEEN